MSYLEIRGGVPLSGRLRVQGAKNSVLPILAAALLAPGQSTIHNCPALSDVAATGEDPASAGLPGQAGGAIAVLVDASQPTGSVIPDPLMREIALLGDLSGGHAGPAGPGGAELSRRL